MTKKQRLTRLALNFGLSILAMMCSGCSPVPAHLDANPKPEDKIEVYGIVPDNVSTKLYVQWETTTADWGCQELYALGDRRPATMKAPVETEPQDSGAQRHWTVWRDGFLAGHCGWRMKGIEVFADLTSSGLPADRKSNISNRIAYVLLNNEPHDNYSWAMNDDASKPVYLYCKFSILRKPDGTTGINISSNPCGFGWEEHHGTDYGKKENILRPDQHRAEFVITNMEQ